MAPKKIQQSSLASNGNPVFYYTKVLQDESASAELFVKQKAGKPGISLARAPLDSALYTATQINWGTGTSFANYVANGFASVINQVSQARRQVSNLISQVSGVLKQIAGNDNGLQSIEGIEQYQILGGDTTHKKYQGSMSDVAVPPLQFVFINEDDTDSYLRKCQNLLMYVLPSQIALDEKESAKSEKELTSYIDEKMNNTAFKEAAQESTSTLETIKKKAAQISKWMSYRENPPGKNGGLKDPTIGYTLLNIENYFEIRLGHKWISYLVPTSVRVNISRSGSCSGKDKKWRPHSVTVSISFDRIGKIFSKDIHTNLLFGDGIKSNNANAMGLKLDDLKPAKEQPSATTAGIPPEKKPDGNANAAGSA